MSERSPYSYAFVIIGLLFLLTQTLRMGCNFLLHLAYALAALLKQLLLLPLAVFEEYPLTTAFWMLVLGGWRYRQPLVERLSNYLQPILLLRCSCSICGEAKCERLVAGCWHAFHEGCLAAQYGEAKDSSCLICASMKCPPERTNQQQLWRSLYGREGRYFLMLFVGVGLFDIAYPYCLHWLNT